MKVYQDMKGRYIMLRESKTRPFPFDEFDKNIGWDDNGYILLRGRG